MTGGETPETYRATHERQVTNLRNCCILLVVLFESYDDAQTCERQTVMRPWISENVADFLIIQGPVSPQEEHCFI
jgi:hypothetical protein